MTPTKLPIRFFLASVFSAILMLVVVLACSSNEVENVGDLSDSSQTEEESVQLLNPTGLFTVDDVVAAGWKKSKELSSETLPDATSVWYGFYKKRDVEVRIFRVPKRVSWV